MQTVADLIDRCGAPFHGGKKFTCWISVVLARFSHRSRKNDDTVSIERRVRRSDAQRPTVSTLCLVLGSALAFFLRRSLQQLGLRAAPRHRFIAPLRRARLSIALTRVKFGLASLLIFVCTGASFAQLREERMLVSYGGLGGYQLPLWLGADLRIFDHYGAQARPVFIPSAANSMNPNLD